MRVSDWMPEPLLVMGPGGLAVWQWLGIVVLLAGGYLVGRIGTWLLAWIGTNVAGRTSTSIDDELVAKLRSPLRMLGTLGVIRLGIVLLALHKEAYRIAMSILLALFAFALVWAALRSIDVITAHVSRAPWALERPSTRSLINLLARIGKVLVIVIAGIGFLSGIGLPVASLLAGLGIGGIALAFGAQKTVENLFGTVSIGVDRPFREGDFVKVEDNVLGTVEAVGLRSTRFRTLDRTIVTLPNGRLADMRIETYALRDRIRLFTILNLVYETTSAQMKDILAGLEDVLRKHPNIWPDEVTVRFMQFGSSSLDVEVMAWFVTTDFNQFRVMRQEVLLGFMEVVERAGSAFAFPTRTIHMVEGPRDRETRGNGEARRDSAPRHEVR